MKAKLKMEGNAGRLGYIDPLYLLAFDHRRAYANDPSGKVSGRLTDVKKLIFEGLIKALDMGLPRDAIGILVDEEFGSAVADRAHNIGLTLVMPVEKSGEAEFDFEYGSEVIQHLDKFDADFAKALIYYNPGANAAVNDRQRDRLHLLSDSLRRRSTKLMLELIVRPTQKQRDAGFSDESTWLASKLRLELELETIVSFQETGIEPDLWKLQAPRGRTAAVDMVDQVRLGPGRKDVRCVLLGGGAPTERVDEWVRLVAPVAGYTGFAIGRSIWSEPVERYLKGGSRDEASDMVANRFAHFVVLFDGERGPESPSFSLTS